MNASQALREGRGDCAYDRASGGGRAGGCGMAAAAESTPIAGEIAVLEV